MQPNPVDPGNETAHLLADDLLWKKYGAQLQWNLGTLALVFVAFIACIQLSLFAHGTPWSEERGLADFGVVAMFVVGSVGLVSFWGGFRQVSRLEVALGIDANDDAGLESAGRLEWWAITVRRMSRWQGAYGFLIPTLVSLTFFEILGVVVWWAFA